MRANVIVKNLKDSNGRTVLLQNLEAIRDLSDIKFDTEESRLSFKYDSDDAVFSAIRYLKHNMAL